MEASPVRQWTDVSPEMASFVGAGPVGAFGWPPEAAAFIMTFGALGAPAILRFIERPTAAGLDAHQDMRVILLVARSACDRLLDGAEGLGDGGAYHLPAALRAIAVALRDCDMPEAARTPYRLAKSIELLCDTLRSHADNMLIPVTPDASLSQADTQRLLAARRMIDERWSEKLTLDMIARASGLNRAKLTRGFRDMFDCSVADAIASQRLGEAGQLLLATDLPVSSIGYRCGYLNNASFARAFARRFGVAPTHYRAKKLAA